MTGLRRAIGPLAAVWLSCHVASVALVPIAISASAADTDVAGCSCVHGAEATCPMHHQTSPHSKVCVMRGMDDQASVVLAFIFAWTGFIPSSDTAIVPPSNTLQPITVTFPLAGRPTPPEPPPPRA